MNDVQSELSTWVYIAIGLSVFFTFLAVAFGKAAKRCDYKPPEVKK